MMWKFRKGDLAKVNGKLAIIDSEVYTQTLHDKHDRDNFAADVVNVVFPQTGIVWTVKVLHVEMVGREFP
jgi:hypothetical protein